MDPLPIEIVFDIFSHIPVKSLLQCTLVSKQWKSIIDNPLLNTLRQKKGFDDPKNLLLVHQLRNPRIQVLSREGEEEEEKGTLKRLTDFGDRRVYSLKCCCHGLLCFTDKLGSVTTTSTPALVLYDPLRGEAFELPKTAEYGQDIEPRMFSYGLGFDFLMETYKVVRLFSNRDILKEISSSSSSYAEIYTLGANSWRMIDCEVPEYHNLYDESLVCMKGVLYWICNVFNEEDVLINNGAGLMVLSIDLGKEEFGLISLPHSSYIIPKLVDVGGFLGVLACSFDDHSIEIWVMKEHCCNKKKWIKEHRLEVKIYVEELFDLRVIGPLQKGEILINIRASYFSYNLSTCRLKFVNLSGTDHGTKIFTYKENLVSLSLFKLEKVN